MNSFGDDERQKRAAAQSGLVAMIGGIFKPPHPAQHVDTVLLVENVENVGGHLRAAATHTPTLASQPTGTKLEQG